MNQHGQPAAGENPFCSRRIRPGALPFLFAPGESCLGLVDRLRQNAWWGQIIGPHGTGKSALVASLRPAIEEAGRPTLLLELYDRQRRLPAYWRRTPVIRQSRPVLMVDGYEQLARWHRFRLKRFCRRHGFGLVVTAHTSVGLPDLFHTASTVDLAQKIVDHLQDGFPADVTSQDVAELFAHHAGDLRELLFSLYDRYAEREAKKAANR